MDLLDVKQAAEVLGVTPARVRQLAGEGRIGQKVGARWVFTRENLEAFAKLDRPAGRPVVPVEVGDETH